MGRKKDIILVSLEFAREKLSKNEFIYHTDLYNHLVELKYFSRENAHTDLDIVRGIYEQIFTFANSEGKRMMNLNSYLGLLDYEDLEQARKDSSEARREANQALFWTKISLLLATIVGVMQIILGFLGK